MTRPSLCVGFVRHRCPGARPGLRQSLSAVLVHRCYLWEQLSPHRVIYGSPEFVFGCPQSPVALWGPGLLHAGEFVRDWIPSELLLAPWSPV